ncbi:MAG: hypothetical protein LBE27_06055 [Deltaproteobacteria bacterium]|jgi:hypothetical protein|nr:hypothetical protein [Deltaproteobacteria bacterium]
MRLKSALISILILGLLLCSLAIFIKTTVEHETRQSLSLFLDRVLGLGNWNLEGFDYELFQRRALMEELSFQAPEGERDDSLYITRGSVKSLSVSKPLMPKSLISFSRDLAYSETEDFTFAEALSFRDLAISLYIDSIPHKLTIKELSLRKLMFLGLKGPVVAGGLEYFRHMTVGQVEITGFTLSPEGSGKGLTINLSRFTLTKPKAFGRESAAPFNLQGFIESLVVESVDSASFSLSLPQVIIEATGANYRGWLMGLPESGEEKASVKNILSLAKLKVSSPEESNEDSGELNNKDAAAASSNDKNAAIASQEVSLNDDASTNSQSREREVPLRLLELDALTVENGQMSEIFSALCSLGPTLGSFDPLGELALSTLFASQASFESLNFQTLSLWAQGFPVIDIGAGSFRGDFVMGEIPQEAEVDLSGVELHFLPTHSLIPKTLSLGFSLKKDPSSDVLALNDFHLEAQEFLGLSLFLAIGGLTPDLIHGLKTIPLSQPRAAWSLKAMNALSLLDFSLKLQDHGGLMMTAASLGQAVGQSPEVYLDALTEKLRYVILTRVDPFLQNAEELSLSLSSFLSDPSSLDLFIKPERPMGLDILHSELMEPGFWTEGKTGATLLLNLLKTLDITLAVNGSSPLSFKWREVPQAFDELDLESEGKSRDDVEEDSPTSE